MMLASNKIKICSKEDNVLAKQRYLDNLHGFIWEAKQAGDDLLIEESAQEDIVCEAKDFWRTVGIDVMDIMDTTESNEEYIICEYIRNDTIYITYKNRIITVSIA